jgi:hypothetical protein
VLFPCCSTSTGPSCVPDLITPVTSYQIFTLHKTVRLKVRRFSQPIIREPKVLCICSCLR